MNLYAESSAVLCWLLGEGQQEAVREALATAEMVVASDLTLVECDRVLIRAVTTGQIPEAVASDRGALLDQASQHWTVLAMDPEIIERSRRPFPREPIRTLDALHLAAALIARRLVPGISLLSLDDRIRTSARALGFQLVPPMDT